MYACRRGKTGVHWNLGVVENPDIIEELILRERYSSEDDNFFRSCFYFDSYLFVWLWSWSNENDWSVKDLIFLWRLNIFFLTGIAEWMLVSWRWDVQTKEFLPSPCLDSQRKYIIEWSSLFALTSIHEQAIEFLWVGVGLVHKVLKVKKLRLCACAEEYTYYHRMLCDMISSKVLFLKSIRYAMLIDLF